MCIAIPAKIMYIDKPFADVDIMGLEKKVNIQLIENPNVGDYILIHSDCGIQKIDSSYFNYLTEVFQEVLDR